MWGRAANVRSTRSYKDTSHWSSFIFEIKEKSEKSKIKLKVLLISENFLLLIELQGEFPLADRIVGEVP